MNYIINWMTALGLLEELAKKYEEKNSKLTEMN